MSNEKNKNPGCLGYVGDGKLPSYVGIIISIPCKAPYSTTRLQWKVRPFFFPVAQVVFLLGQSN